MRAKCIGASLTPEQRLLMGRAATEAQDFHLEVGKTYLVVGLQFSVDSNVLGTGTWLHVVNENDKLSWAPASLFEIADPRVSAYWIVDTREPGQTRIWPELLYRPFFHEDLGEGDPETVAQFEELVRLLNGEHS